MDEPQFAGTPRFRILRRLGAGGMGVVYEAEDLARGHRVALKTLKDQDRDSLYRLKREFRALADLSHPNLAAYYDLVIEEQASFFTMELVEGVDFAAWCRREGDLDEARLRTELVQLVSGLETLHRAGKLHRDIKPSNVQVSREGRVVVLDFGLIQDWQPSAQSTLTGRGVGTAAYMSPEQAEDSSTLTPASDWYAVGVLLYRVLTGRVPFSGSAFDVLQAKRESDPSSPRHVNPTVPADLDALCLGLLDRRPEKRPAAAAILAALSSAPTLPAVSAEISPGFVGRRLELAALGESFTQVKAGELAVHFVQGASGIGKSALVRQFLAELKTREADLVVLEGRCYERETVPYKAMDSLIDDLQRYWKALPRADAMYLLPRSARLLPRLFPVLGRVPAIMSVRPGQSENELDPQELRSRAVAALREALERLAARHRVVMFLDDLQWVDADSVKLLGALCAPPQPPALLLLLCSRDQVRHELWNEWAEALGPSRRESTLGPLPKDEALSLAHALLGNAADSLAVRVAEEAGGSPFFVHELAQYLGSATAPASQSFDLSQVVLDHVSRLPEASCRLLELVALAGQPVTQRAAAHAAYLGGEQAVLEIHRLRNQRLLRTAAGPDEDRVEPYHDRIRETVLTRIEHDRRRRHHLALALALESTGVTGPELLAHHWQGAGEAARAFAYALRAAEDASQALAFDLAARFYQVILSLHAEAASSSPARWLLQSRLGDALANAGRGAEAAEAFTHAAAAAPSPDAHRLKHRAAEQLLRSGHIEEGIAAMAPILAARGLDMPASVRASMWSFLLGRIRLAITHPRLGFRERPANEVPKDQLLHLDLCWSVMVGMFMVHQLRGMDYQVRHLRLALTAGEPSRIACALGMEAISLALLGSRPTRWKAVLERADHLADRCGNTYASGMVALAHASVHNLKGIWRQTSIDSARAEELLRATCTGVFWEVSTARLTGLLSLSYLGQLQELRRRVNSMWRDARARGDLYALACATSGLPNMAWLVEDDPDEARRRAREGIERWSRSGFHFQHMTDLVARVQTDLYQRNGASAHRVMEQGWKTLQKTGLLRIGRFRIVMLDLRARAALSAAQGNEAQCWDLLRAARVDTRRLAREPAAWSHALSALLHAQMAAAQGHDGAPALFDTAARLLDAADMAMHAAATRYRQGQLVGGTTGQTLVAGGTSFFTDQGAVRPDRWVDMLVPLDNLGG